MGKKRKKKIHITMLGEYIDTQKVYFHHVRDQKYTRAKEKIYEAINNKEVRKLMTMTVTTGNLDIVTLLFKEGLLPAKREDLHLTNNKQLPEEIELYYEMI